jgi:glutaredoxin
VTTNLTLVSSAGCHFCDRARSLLAELGVEPLEVAVDSAEAHALAERGVALVFLPVLTDGRRVIAYGRFSRKRLVKELAL